MGLRTSIEWTDSTWNPVTGCTKISQGCRNCYAERMALRLKAAGNPRYLNGFQLTLHDDMLELPLKWKRPQTIFVNSMSDLFHEEVPTEFILQVFDVMRKANWHRYQILTKRSRRLANLGPKLTWMPHIWMGVTVEEQGYVDRIDDLRQSGASVKFLSLEPLLGPIERLPLPGIDWVIVGGESGPKCRPVKESWVLGLRDQCLANAVPFFFKQWGGTNKKKAGRDLAGQIWNQLPLEPQTNP